MGGGWPECCYLSKCRGSLGVLTKFSFMIVQVMHVEITTICQSANLSNSDS